MPGGGGRNGDIRDHQSRLLGPARRDVSLMGGEQRVCLTSIWYLKPEIEDAVLTTIHTEIVPRINAEEPGTLAYLVHRPHTIDPRLQSLPPADPGSLLFYEGYASPAAFPAHVAGPIFTAFVERHGDRFAQAGGKPFTITTFLSREAGFTRGRGEPEAVAGGNRHPAIMFEVLSPDAPRSRDFYGAVFGWRYPAAAGPDPFRYVHFPAGSPPLLGGIGSPDPNVAGYE